MPADPDMLVTLATARTEFEGAAMRSVLEGEGIPTRVFAGTANMLGWEGGYANNVRVMVRRADAVRAAEAIAVNRRTAPLVDWSRVDVGAFEDGEPPTPADQHARTLSRARIRRAGMLLIAGAAVAPRFGPEGLVIAMIAFIAIMALSWNDG
jgi:hypothetical protein